jgi:hypothetical protein
MNKRAQHRWTATFHAALALAFLSAPEIARAESWLVVPATSDDQIERSLGLATRLVEKLANHDLSVASSSDAAKSFEENESRPAADLDDQDIQAWGGQSKSGLRDLARKDFAAALAELEQAQAFSRRAAHELNRDTKRAEQLLDTCLYTVRALLGSKRRAEAEAQAEECARLSLRAKPHALMHPPDVRAFYQSVVERGADGEASLVVEADREGCDVRVNGIPRGRTPSRVERLLHGSYDLQVECDGPRGRVHHIEVSAATTEVFIDTRFDRSVRTGSALFLSNPSWPDAETRIADAMRIADAAQADVVVLVTPADDAPLELWATARSGEPKGFVRMAAEPEGPTDEQLDAAAQILVSGKCIDLSQAQSVVVSCRTGRLVTRIRIAADTRRADGPPRAQFIPGVTLASIGAASLLTSYALAATANTSAADDMAAFPSNDNQARWLNLRSGMYYTGAVGAGLLVTAMPLALPYHRKPPWWAWLCGGAGVALAATSITLAVTAPSEPEESRVANPQGYVDRAKRTDPAFATGVTAAPLLTVPLVYLLRRDEKRTRASLAPQVVVSRAGGFLALEGRY